MKPRTKKEKLVAKLSKKLGSIGKRDEQKLIKNTYGSCSFRDMYYRCYAVINQSYQGWQVLRYFRIMRHRNKQREVSYSIWEVMQLWNKVGEGQVFLSRKRTMGLYVDTFIYNSDLEIRKHGVSYSGLDIANLPYDYIYNKSLDGIYAEIESSFNKRLDEVYGTYINRRKMYEMVSETKYPETFIKAQPSLFANAEYYGYKDTNFATAFKIVVRHHYEVEDPASYMDYLKALIYLGKDLHNPFYVCPDDFEYMHDTYIAKMKKQQDKMVAEKIAKEQEKANEQYIAWRKRFFDMVISDGTIECRILRSVEDFFKEGEAMHNCVYQCDYYKKPYSLIFSARKDGKRVETVEFDLTKNKVIQAYGKCNKFSAYHEEVVNLVNSYAGLIQLYNKKGNEQLKLAV